MTADPGFPTMKDRKQGAIGLLGEWRDNILRPNALSPEECYDRIAPHIRGEFPDEALRDLLLDVDLWSKEGLFWKIKCLIQGHPAETGEKGREFPEEEVRRMIFEFAVSFGDRGLRTHSMERQAEILANLKRLWEGPGHTAEVRKKVEQDDPNMKPEYDFSKGVRGVAISGKPKGTCQHEGLLETAIIQGHTLPTCAACGDKVDQREGAERRTDKTATAWLCDPPNAPAMIYAEDGEWGIDRRELPERRKAGSG